MREEFKTEVWRDFQQRYQSTYGWYEKKSGDKVLVMLEEVTSNACKFSDEDGNIFTALADKENHFQFLPVIRGLYQTSHGIIHCRRVPARQYKRGIADTNTVLHIVPSGYATTISFSILREMFSPSNVDYVARYKAGMDSDLVINNLVAITPNAVWVYNNKVGKKIGSTLLLKGDLFRQEIVDAIQAKQLELHVEVE